MIFKKLLNHRGKSIQLKLKNESYTILTSLGDVIQLDEETLIIEGIQELAGLPRTEIIKTFSIRDIEELRLYEQEDEK